MEAVVFEVRRKLIDILAEVSQETGVDVVDIIGPVKRALYVKARSFFARRAYAVGYKLIDIGEALGRSHTAVLAYLEEEEENMDKAELKKRIAGLSKDERKDLVSEIAESGTKEERDNLAALFSGAQGSSMADVEKNGAGRKAIDEALPAAKKKSFADDLDDI